MKHISNLLYILLILCLSGSLFAQKNPDLKKANKQFELHAFNLAIKSYKKVLGKNSTSVEAMSGLANCYRHLGRMGEAANWYSKSLKEPGFDPINILNYGKSLMGLGKYEKAEEWFSLYAESQPIYGQHFSESCRFAISMRGLPGLYRVKREYANSEASDFGPAFYEDKVVFSSARTDIKRKKDSDKSNWEGGSKNQLFYSAVDKNGYLESPQFLRNDLKNVYNEGLISYSKDGKWVAYTKNNFADGTRQIPSSGIEMSIYIAEVTAGGNWENEKAFPFNGNGYSSGYPHLSSDGQTLYFASDRPDGFGGYDIYMSSKNVNTWSTPENLGPIINSEGNEVTPFLENDLLYFSSDWHHGLGGMDIFRAIKENGSWSKVFHLGNTINSPGDDFGLIIDSEKNHGYFVSNRKGGEGNEDIYRLSKISNDMVIVVEDTETNKPIEKVKLDFTNCGSGVFTTDIYGKYRFQTFEDLSCDIIISKDGYQSTILQLQGQTKNKELSVGLTKSGSIYNGLIVNSTDNTSVRGVVVKASSKKDGSVLTAQTDAAGSYGLALKPNTTYMVRYSKAGFIDTHQQFVNGDGTDKRILGILTFNPAGTNLDKITEVVETSRQPDSRPVADSKSEAIDIGSLEIVTEKFVQEGFSVQVAAVDSKEPVKAENYVGLKSIGNIYSRPENGYKKVRVGIFTSREDAENARNTISAKGFKSAFIVAERLETMEEVEMYGEKEASASDQKSKVEVTTSKGKYLVRLATYKNPDYFDSSRVKNIGSVEKRKKGDMTIMLLGYFTTVELAKVALTKAVKSGFKGAYVVTEEDGEIIKVGI